MTHRYRRILLKLSGEALAGGGDGGIDAAVLARISGEIGELVRDGVEVGLVIGGGNIFRGSELVAAGLDRVTGDQMGMLATVINALALQSALNTAGCVARVLSAFPAGTLTEPFDHRRAVAHLASGEVVIFAAGTGNPFFTTDSAASLRAIEIGADVLIKATKVDGIYAADPVKQPDAEHYPELTYDEVITRRLAVMDTTAVVLCRDHRLPLRVMNINRPGALQAVVRGDDIGTLVREGGEK
ncbi:MAG: UMP kinase [Gammaproteobacteria bacterium]|nr:MAG: UMP kinase [Gammaproteobacteria bacterium]